ncbi:MAG: hypothetical protein JKY67_10810 [Pseudomonadales bacterium]|nr:hypothetical protein [Pseudomonadales bacterium]
MRLPFFLFSETLWVRQTYLWVRPPSEVYAGTAGLHRYNGTSSVYHHNLKNALIEAEIYIGQAKDELSILGQTTLFNTDYFYGGKIHYVTDDLTISASIADTKLHASIPALNYAVITPALLHALGFQFLQNNWGVMWEYSSLDLDSLGSSEGAYLSLHYIIDQWSPFILLGKSSTDSTWAVSRYTGESVTIGCRYSVSDSVSLKAQVLNGELMDIIAILNVPPTAGFDDEVTVVSMTLDFVF